MYIERSIEPIFKKIAKEFPVVVLTGPRQSGKTTFLKHIFGKNIKYVSLDAPDMRELITQDPRGFFERNPPPLILDEIQNTPEILSYIKEAVDLNRDIPGQYFLTGSQNLLLSEKVGESLAGRAAILKLFPLSLREICGDPERKLPWQQKEKSSKNPIIPSEELWSLFLRGSYPELIKSPHRDPYHWYDSYAQTYLERDIRSLRQIGDLREFQVFLKALAARNAQLLNASELARDIGISVNTVKAWISILEATYQIHIIRPYYNNIGKRMVKSPKIYFSDIGMLCYLVGLKDADHARQGPMAGSIFETAVVNEVIKTYTHQGISPQVYFWRTSSGTEVDLLVEDGMSLIPIEIKASSTLNQKMIQGIESLMEDFKNKIKSGYVVYSGGEQIFLKSTIQTINISQL